MGGKNVQIVEVGPRDGLQNESSTIPTADKIKLIENLVKAGCSKLEVTSFVRADKIPQMADSKQLFNQIPESIKESHSLACLVPNLKGLEMAKECGVKEIALFTATSETFNKKNINATIEESLERLRPVAVDALKNKMKLRGYVSTAFACPYEGKTSLETLKMVINRLLDFGVYEISIGDTIGIATPRDVEVLLEELEKHFDFEQLAMHFHDTWGMGVANVSKSYEMGIRTFDSSVGGLGGCPYADGATGNVATEDLVYLFDGLGVNTGIDLEKLVNAGQDIFNILKKKSPSRVHQAFQAKRK